MENDEKSDKKLENFAKELESDFSNFGENEGKNAEKTENTSIGTSFICPVFILDFLQDKPVWLQKRILCKNLSPDEIKAVEHIFKPGPDEIIIARQVIKKYVEKLVSNYPGVEKYLTDESVFLGSWSISFYERKKLIEGYLDKEMSKA